MASNYTPPSTNGENATFASGNLRQRTTTIVLDKLKPLILKLKSPERKMFGLGSAIKPDQNIEEMIDALGEELMKTITTHVDGIRDQVKQTRPQPNEENYEEKMQVYTEMVKLVTELLEILSKMICESLDDFHKLIDQLWNDLQNSQNEREIENVIKEFNKKTDELFGRLMSDKIDPMCHKIESKLVVVKRKPNQSSPSPPEPKSGSTMEF